jgi:sugar phosphate permease
LLTEESFTRYQWRIILLGWVTYAAFYLGRANLATALPALQIDLHWSPEQTSLLVGAGMWTYALGQLVNGWLGHHVNTRRLVAVGILGSALFNVLIGLSSSLPLMILLGMVNGFLQSMGWGPILRTLSDTLSSGQRRRIAGVFGASYVVGNAFTWMLTGLLLRNGQWRLTFLIPPLLMLIIGLAWYVLGTPAKISVQNSLPLNRASVSQIFGEFWHIVIAALVAGILFGGVLAYAPSYVAQTLPLDQAALTAIVLPLFGLIGTAWLGGWIVQRLHGNVLRALILLLLLTALSRGLALLLPMSTLSAVVLLAAMGVTSYALTNVILTAIPLTVGAHLGTSMVAGTMDAVHSVGSAVGSTMVGLLLARGGWPLVFSVWLTLPLITVIVIGTVVRYQMRHRIDPKEQMV